MAFRNIEFEYICLCKDVGFLKTTGTWGDLQLYPDVIAASEELHKYENKRNACIT